MDSSSIRIRIRRAKPKPPARSAQLTSALTTLALDRPELNDLECSELRL